MTRDQLLDPVTAPIWGVPSNLTQKHTPFWLQKGPPFWPKKGPPFPKIGSGFLRKPDPWGYQIHPNSGGSGVAWPLRGSISNWTQKWPWICGQVFLAKAENPPHGHFWLILSPKGQSMNIKIDLPLMKIFDLLLYAEKVIITNMFWSRI